MDAVKYLKEAKRMCSKHKSCEGCPIESFCFTLYKDIENPEKMVDIVEKWAKEHPVKTRQSEFLKMFPNVPKPLGHVDFCPKYLGESKGITCNGECSRCKREFWLAEVE